jgi:hypothetical protein
MTAIAQSHPSGALLRAPVVREAVDTLRLKFAGVVAFTVSVAGTLQVAPWGAPIQLIEAVPPIPPPPRDSA